MKKKIITVFSGVLCFCSSMSLAQGFESIIHRYIKTNSLKDKKSDLSDFIIDNKDYSTSLKGDVIKIQQTYNGLPIFNAVSTALIKDNTVIYYTDGFLKNYEKADHMAGFLNPKQAFDKLAESLILKDKSKYRIINFKEKTSDNTKAAKQRLLYAKNNGSLELCYEFILPENENYWDILINAKTGEIISKMSLKNECHFSDNPDQPKSIVSSPKNKGLDASCNAESRLSPDNASYNIFALPVEAPNFGTRTTVSNPWILSSSPEGWHSDGTNHYTNTQGNNVVAFYSNSDFSTFTLPDGGSIRNFNFPFNDNASTDANMNACAANLFYSTNKAHDILYQFGFTETARNFQENNFGNGGVAGDPIQGIILPLVTNNASFVNHPDGTSGELSVQLWNEPAYLSYNSPATAQTRNVRTKRASFGVQLNAAGVAGDISIPTSTDGCTSLPLGSLNNKIGLIKSGNCDDAVKVKNAQNAGAIACVVYEASQVRNFTKMTGNDSSITIPSLKILNSEGEYMKNLLTNSNTVTVTLKDDPLLAKEKNLGFDNVVTMHEYVHGLSNRLTGTGYSCLDKNVSAEQMGEGWSDFYAMMFTNKPEYTSATARGFGTYLVNEPVTGIGVRPARYSPNFAINNFTYGDTNGMEFNDGTTLVPDEHSIGFVWATMLWDLHWEYVGKYGYSSDLMSNTTNGSSRVFQLVTDAMKLQACNPTFIDGRNAILAAEQATTGGADKCMIWRTFAKRGLGTNAQAGSKTNINDQIQDFTIPSECPVLAANDVKSMKNNTISIYPNPAKNEFYLSFPSSTIGKVSIEIYDMSGKLISSEGKIPTDTKKIISTDGMINGTYMIKVKGLGFEATSKVIVRK